MNAKPNTQSITPAAQRELTALLERRPELAACAGEIETAFHLIATCFRSGGRMYLCGNGGSAADCEHWAGELLKGFYSRRPPRAKGLPRDLRSLEEGLPAIPLTGFLSLRTAVANDIDARLEFAQLVWALGRPGDVLVGISTSGQAENVCRAARAAQHRNMSIIGLTGEGGGALRRLAHPCIRVPATRTHLVQELHLSVYHALCLALEAEFFPTPSQALRVVRNAARRPAP